MRLFHSFQKFDAVAKKYVVHSTLLSSVGNVEKQMLRSSLMSFWYTILHNEIGVAYLS
jgi:hypothetical protein